MASTSSSVTASPSTQGWTYDVFLSFRGPDTRKTFIDFLYESLQRRGIRTFKDDDRLEKGDCIPTSLIKGIQESQFLIAVFSEGYASSKWCLEELATMMDCHEKLKNQIVVPIFYNVEPSDVRKQEGRFGDSFTKLVERFVKDKEKVIRRWKEALKNAGYLKGHHLQNDHNGFNARCAEKVAADINARLNQASLASEDNLVGLESRVNNIINWLRLASDDADADADADSRFIGICGMGGIGKTTTAKVVFNRFSHQFDGACFLDDVRQHNALELQKTLLTKIQKGEVVEISNVDAGKWMIKNRLEGKKVLIVLDDVDDQLEQLDELAGGRDWFGRGSRVIITTRNEAVLRSHGIDKKYIYGVHTLGDEEGIQLFRLYAFKKKPKTGVEQLCKFVVRYCEGLPLALKVLGSFLCGLEVDEWVSALNKLKDTPHRKIHETLKISFDGLDPKNKKIFLYIACFFRHERVEYVKDFLKSCGLHPDIGMRELIDKSLISVNKSLISVSRLGRIEMHDLIQEMGCNIAKEEKPRSMVWEFKELCGKMVAEHIECIVFPYTCKFRWQNSAFKALKILIGKQSYNEEDNNSNLVVKDNYELPSSLELIHFPYYPFPSLPITTLEVRKSFLTTFHPSGMDDYSLEFVVNYQRRCSLGNSWITKELNNLTYLNLSSSEKLLETPNFDMMPNLERLHLSDCWNLKEVHPSIGNLQNLVLLDLSECYKLENLPTFIQVSSLEYFKLERCESLENFPEIQADMPRVSELNLEDISIRELPSSIGRLCGLIKLCLFNCDYLVHLSDDLCKLKSLEILELNGCVELESLPGKLGNLSNLKELHILDTAILQLPSSITQLSSLEYLCWGRYHLALEFDGGKPLKFMSSVSGLGSLKTLRLCGFKTIKEGLPSDLGQSLISLEYLNLQESNFRYLPESFNQLRCLQYLDIRDCKKLKRLPELPVAIEELYVDSYFAFGNKSINIDMFAIKYPKLYSISFSSEDRFVGETFLAKKSIQFPFHRKTPFSVTCSSIFQNDDIWRPQLRSFKYRRFKSNKISFNLNHHWYSTKFVGFAVFFVSSQADDIWGPHLSKHFDDACTHHCVIKAKLSSNDNEDLERKCKLAGSTSYGHGVHICFVYLPFSSLWHESESKPMTKANDYSRFEVGLVNLEASADWGINLLYKSPEGAREHMANYHMSDSGLLTTNDIGCLTSLESEIQYLNHCSNIECLASLESKREYLNKGSGNFVRLPVCYSQLSSLQYLDISGCYGCDKKLKELPELPTTLRELYANSDLVSESKIAKLATKYPKLYSVSLSFVYKDVSVVGLARNFVHHAPFRIMRNSPFIVTYGYFPDYETDFTKWFKYSSYRSNKISISLKPSWHNQNFVGFVVCFHLRSSYPIWKSCQEGRPFRYGQVKAQLVHKDNAANEEVLQTNCDFGRLLCDEEFYDEKDIMCFAYIPFLSLFNNKLGATPSDYLVFEVSFGDPASNALLTDWSCGLLYKNDESLSEAIWSKTTSHHNADSGVETKKRTRGLSLACLSKQLTTVCTMNPTSSVSGKEGEGEEMVVSLDGDEDVEEYEAKESNGQGVEVVMSEHNDSVNKKENERDDDQRKKARLNKDKTPIMSTSLICIGEEDMIINSRKQNKGKNEHGEILVTNKLPPLDDDVLHRLGNDCKQLHNFLIRKQLVADSIVLKSDYNIFHHSCDTFVVIESITELFMMKWLDVSIIQVFIMFLHRLCKEHEVNSIGFMCPTKIAKAYVDGKLNDAEKYLDNAISRLQDKTFILAPYHQENHWLLLAICTNSRMVYVLDPLKCDHRDIGIKPMLNMVLQRFEYVVDWKNIQCPQQPGGTECGYYVMKYMYEICTTYVPYTSLDKAFQEIELYCKEEIDEIRNMWAKYLYECIV